MEFQGSIVKVINKIDFKKLKSVKINTGKTTLTIIILNLSQLALIAAILLYLVDLDGG
mgnify:FL=1